jgi:signal transduction histidine kinase
MARDALYSLRWRLPLLAGGVMAVLLVAFLWTAYLRVQAALLDAAGERAQIAADQVADILDGQRTIDLLGQIAVDRALRQFLELRTEQTRQAAAARVSTLAGSGVRRVELWDAAGARLLEAGPRGSDPNLLPPGSFPLVPGIHELQTFGKVVFSDLVAGIRGADQPLGFVLIRSTFSENPPGIFSRMVGRDAQVRVGNRRGDVWTNFSGVVPPMPVDLEHPGVVQYRAPSGEMRLGAVAHIRATPLAAWVEFPLEAAIAPAGVFLRQMVPIAVLFLLTAAIALQVLSARITRPLRELTDAAEAISSGDYSRRVKAGTRDEVGRLARTFNTMAGQVQDSQQRLEARVAERTARLGAANAELEAFSYSVSHDLRAPLRGIDGFSQALLEEAGDKLNSTEIGYLHRVRAAAQRMAALIDDLLELGRVGRAELSRDRVDLSAMAREIAEELRRTEPGTHLEFEIQDGLVVTADRGLIRIVLDNLLGNAWKFTANVPAGRIQVGAEQRADEVVYFVRDNGAGFDMAYVDKLFQPFQRLHRSTDFKGTGIGLATVHRIITRHEGRVWAEGAVAAGATVRFTIPNRD